jgi:hypothetical protein
MIGETAISLVNAENAAQFAAMLSSEDIPSLIARLDSPEDRIRYPAFLLLRAYSVLTADLYPFWDVLDGKLTDTNSYQRSIGAMLLAANVRHDSAGKIEKTLPRYLALLVDPKPITVRQCAQALPDILRAKPELAQEIAQSILQIDLIRFKETMRKLILVDFLETLLVIRNLQPFEELEQYFFFALSGSILDKKAKEQFRTRLSQDN